MSNLKELGRKIGKLVEEKDKAYGSAFSKSEGVLKILYPNGITPDQYKNLLPIVRVIDKLFRVANNKYAFSEDPWKDIAGYALLSLSNNQD